MSSVPAILLAASDTDLPPLTPGRIISAWTIDPWLAAIVVAVGGLYLYGVSSLKRRGDAWPVGRTVAFLAGGLGTMCVATMSSLGTYDDELLSVHMIQHMVLGMIAPIFLALGAPVTLALRTLPVGGRKRLVAVLHSRPAKVLSFPLVSYAIFVANPFALYFTGLYRQTLEHPLFHEFVHLHFLVTGCLFFWPLLGLDPLPGRWPYPGRALLMLLSTPFHAVLGLTIMQSATLIAGDWYPNLHLTWANPKDDQVLAGGILWAGGEVVSVTMLAVLVVQWMRDADKEARRVDRKLDRERHERALTPGAGAAATAVSTTTAAVESPATDAADDLWETPWWERSSPS